MKLDDVTGYSDVGRHRDHNEDAFLVMADIGLVAVADGMGGLEHGEVASSTAIEVLKQAEKALRGVIAAVDREPGRGARSQLSHAMRWLTDLGSQTIMQITRGSSSGTTLVVGCVAGGHLLIANTGDSRAYLFRQGKVRALTDDHTVAAAHMRAGRITKEEHDASPYQHMLYQALGTQSELDPDIFDEPAAVGDVLLVCSDGLTGPVSEDNIARILTEPSNLDRAAAALIQAANDNGGPDNITVVLTRITSGGDPATLEEERRLFLGCPLLSTLSDTERRQLRHYVDREAFEADAPFNNPEAFYLLLSGKARRPDGREAGPGDVVGLRRFAGAAEAAVEVATEPCVALRLSLGAYDTLERQRPTIAARMMRQLLTLMARGVA